jgi:hypothetical protein
VKANHFAEHKPCVVLFVKDPENPQVLSDNENKAIVFERFTKARKYVANNIEAEYQPFIQYVNEDPSFGAGDREETHHKKCLKCDGYLRPGENSASTLPSGDVVSITTFDCPKCDLGEA